MVLTMPHDAKAVDTMIKAMKKMVAWGCLEMPGGAERNPEYALRFFVDLGALFLPLDASPCRSWAHSHSIVAGGLPETSYTTRERPGTSLMMRREQISSSS